MRGIDASQSRSEISSSKEGIALKNDYILFMFIVACVVVGAFIYHILYKICKSCRNIRNLLYEKCKFFRCCKHRTEIPPDSRDHFMQASAREISPEPRP